MTALMNQQQLLASRPDGEPTPASFRLVETPVPELGDGQVLVRHHYLSLDPYMRGRMNEGKSYAAPQALDQVMVGGTVGEVVLSKNPAFLAGDRVVGWGGWQQYSIVDAAPAAAGALQKVDASRIFMLRKLFGANFNNDPLHHRLRPAPIIGLSGRIALHLDRRFGRGSGLQ